MNDLSFADYEIRRINVVQDGVVVETHDFSYFKRRQVMPIPVSEAGVIPGLTEKTVRKLIKNQELTPIGLNGVYKDSQGVKGDPVCFDFIEWQKKSSSAIKRKSLYKHTHRQSRHVRTAK